MPDEERSLYDFLSNTRKGNFLNYEGLALLLAEYELKKTISQVYSQMYYPKTKEEALLKFKEIVEDSPIVSFNYDCLVENALDKHELFSYDNRISLQNTKPLIIKPHGSLGWTVCKRYYQQGGTIEVVERNIKREPQTSNFNSKARRNDELDSTTPIIIPMSPGKENFVSGSDPARIKICPDNRQNTRREFIDCVVSYAKMLKVISLAERLIFIGYSFPRTDYESVIIFDLASNSPILKECHICIKGGKIPNPDVSCGKLIYYRAGFGRFLDSFIS